MRNARMCKNIGLDSTRMIHDPVNFWMALFFTALIDAPELAAELLDVFTRYGEIVSEGGGLFLGSSSEVHNLVPPENGVAMYRTAKTSDLVTEELDDFTFPGTSNPTGKRSRMA